MRDWKLIEYLDGTDEFQLFHLSEDISEASNLIEQNPEMANVLKQRLANWRSEIIAEMPIPNPSYDPSRAHEWWSMRSGRLIDSARRKPFPHTERDPR